jgi:hypothetical protein
MRTLLISIVISSLPSFVRAEPLTYSFGPVSLATDYGPAQVHTVSGEITTDGTLGLLEAANFLSWSISVDGPHPKLFQSGDGSYVSPSFVNATSNELIVTRSDFAALFITSNESGRPGCDACTSFVSWQGLPGSLSYVYYSPQDFVPSSTNLGFPTVIASRAPEPTSSVLLVVGIILGAGMLRKRIGK